MVKRISYPQVRLIEFCSQLADIQVNRRSGHIIYIITTGLRVTPLVSTVVRSLGGKAEFESCSIWGNEVLFGGYSFFGVLRKSSPLNCEVVSGRSVNASSNPEDFFSRKFEELFTSSRLPSHNQYLDMNSVQGKRECQPGAVFLRRR